MPLEFLALTLHMIELQLSDSVADTSMLQCSAQFRILFVNAHYVADNASHALASSATVNPTFNDEEEVVVIRNGWTSKKKKIVVVVVVNFIKHQNRAITDNIIYICIYTYMYKYVSTNI